MEGALSLPDPSAALKVHVPLHSMVHLEPFSNHVADRLLARVPSPDQV